MKELLSALELIKKVNSENLDSVAKDFSNYSNQEISSDAVQNFKLTGLDNVAFLTSDYLNYYGVKNLLQHEQK